MIPTLNNGCCGSSLHTSSLVIAWIQVFFSTIWLLIVSVTGTIGIAWIVKEKGDGKEIANNDEFVLQLVFGIALVILAVSFLIDLLLLIGIYKRNYCLMMPYLILGGAGVVMSFLTVIGAFFAIFTNPAAIGQLFLYLIWGAVSGYFWLILYSYFQEIKTQALVNQNTFNKI